MCVCVYADLRMGRDAHLTLISLKYEPPQIVFFHRLDVPSYVRYT